MAAAERAGWGRGARRSESTRAGGGSEPGAQPGNREEPGRSAEPAARDMAKAGRAGEGGRGAGAGGRAGQGRARGRDGAARGGQRIQVRRARRWAEVPEGAGGGGEARPPRVQQGLGAPRVLPVPTVSSWDTASPSPRRRCGPCPAGLWAPGPPSGDPANPGAGAEGPSRGRRSIPCSPLRGAPHVPPLEISRTRQPPDPSAGRTPRFLLGKGGCPAPHPSDRPAPSPRRTREQSLRFGGATPSRVRGAALPPTQAV